MPASSVQSIIAELETNPRFIELRNKAIESKVVGTSDEDLPGGTHRGYYYDQNDESGVFQTTGEIDEYLALLTNGAKHRTA